MVAVPAPLTLPSRADESEAIEQRGRGIKVFESFQVDKFAG
jgi:hypothetical protein